MKLKQGDNVIMISGKDKGKTGKVVRVLRAQEKVVVDGLNIAKKHIRPQGTGRNRQPGGLVEVAMPTHASNVMLVDPKDGKPTRVGKKKDEKSGKNVRVALKSGVTLK